MKEEFASDWLGTAPCFYHERSGKVSTCIHDVIDYRNLEFDGDGLADYLDFGYCAFGHTPVRHVRFVQPGHTLMRDEAGTLREVRQPDPVDQWRGRGTRTEDAIERLRAEVERWEKSVAGEITLPLSGGYDSRLIASMLADKSRVRAFTYGVAERQAQSREVTRARLVAQRLGISWEHVALGRFHERLADWDDRFGVSTHAHGMYHMEFYAEIRRRIGCPGPLASGLVGDAWAGSISPLPARGPEDLPALGLNRGVHAAARASRLPADGRYRREFWSERGAALRDPVFQIVEVIRQKMILLAFALIVPAQHGFKPWSPFLEPDVALAMVTLPPAERRRRQWQTRWLERQGLDVERSAGGSAQNLLDLAALDVAPPEPIAVELVREVLNPAYVAELNRRVLGAGIASRWWARFAAVPAGARGASALRIGNPRLDAYGAFLTLKPIEALLRRRDRA